MTPPEISRIIVEKGEGGCWHETDRITSTPHKTVLCACKCGLTLTSTGYPNPDFSLFENFGRLLKVAFVHEQEGDILKMMDGFLSECESSECIDQIPFLLATEIARVLKEGK